MAKRISRDKDDTVMPYESLRQKILTIAQTSRPITGEFIPDQIHLYWLIGQTLAWHAEDLLEDLALELRRSGAPWRAWDLVKMVQLYFHYPTLERLSGRCVGRNRDMNLDEILNVGK